MPPSLPPFLSPSLHLCVPHYSRTYIFSSSHVSDIIQNNWRTSWKYCYHVRVEELDSNVHWLSYVVTHKSTARQAKESLSLWCIHNGQSGKDNKNRLTWFIYVRSVVKPVIQTCKCICSLMFWSKLCCAQRLLKRLWGFLYKRMS